MWQSARSEWSPSHLTGCVALCAAASAQGANFVLWTSKEDFLSATKASPAVTFEEPEWSVALGSTFYGSIMSGGIQFVPIDSWPVSPNLYVAPASQTNFCCPLTSQTLTSSGNEHIDLVFDPPVGSVGFTCYANQGNPILFTLTLSTGQTVTFSNTNLPGAVGFVGFSSSLPIARLTWLADLGEATNTGIDDVLVGGPSCLGDLDGDGIVGPADLATLLGNWKGSGIGDLDVNGVVGSPDLAILLGAWGPCPSP